MKLLNRKPKSPETETDIFSFSVSQENSSGKFKVRMWKHITVASDRQNAGNTIRYVNNLEELMETLIGEIKGIAHKLLREEVENANR